MELSSPNGYSPLARMGQVPKDLLVMNTVSEGNCVSFVAQNIDDFNGLNGFIYSLHESKLSMVGTVRGTKAQFQADFANKIRKSLHNDDYQHFQPVRGYIDYPDEISQLFETDNFD